MEIIAANMIPAWKSGSHHKVSAAVAVEEINKLVEQGNSNAQALVDVSRPEDAPLHSEFEWDDSIAAEEYRKDQARNIYNSIIYVDVTKPKETQEPIRVYCHVQEVSQNYLPVQFFARSEDSLQSLLSQALRELKAFSRKYSALKDKLPKLFDVIRDLETESGSDTVEA